MRHMTQNLPPRLTLSCRRPLSYRNQSIDLRSKSIYSFLYDNGLRHERVNIIEPSPCVLFFPTYFLVSTQKTEANFQILQMNPLLRLLTSQRYYHISRYEKFIVG